MASRSASVPAACPWGGSSAPSAKRGLSQEDLAHEAGITISTLSLLERGRSNPTWATVKAIAAGLGVSMNELVKLTERLER
jgi:transcriptional regulator with XRE-family HTH domain